MCYDDVTDIQKICYRYWNLKNQFSFNVLLIVDKNVTNKRKKIIKFIGHLCNLKSNKNQEFVNVEF